MACTALPEPIEYTPLPVEPIALVSAPDNDAEVSVPVTSLRNALLYKGAYEALVERRNSDVAIGVRIASEYNRAIEEWADDRVTSFLVGMAVGSVAMGGFAWILTR